MWQMWIKWGHSRNLNTPSIQTHKLMVNNYRLIQGIFFFYKCKQLIYKWKRLLGDQKEVTLVHISKILFLRRMMFIRCLIKDSKIRKISAIYPSGDFLAWFKVLIVHYVFKIKENGQTQHHSWAGATRTIILFFFYFLTNS